MSVQVLVYKSNIKAFLSALLFTPEFPPKTITELADPKGTTKEMFLHMSRLIFSILMLVASVLTIFLVSISNIYSLFSVHYVLIVASDFSISILGDDFLYRS
jgi:hypothetical protein